MMQSGADQPGRRRARVQAPYAAARRCASSFGSLAQPIGWITSPS